MKIKWSRHAKRRAKLYKIPKREIVKILIKRRFDQGRNTIIEQINGIKYPIKVVVSVEEDLITVITSYPLKKVLKNESVLR